MISKIGAQLAEAGIFDHSKTASSTAIRATLGKQTARDLQAASSYGRAVENLIAKDKRNSRIARTVGGVGVGLMGLSGARSLRDYLAERKEEA